MEKFLLQLKDRQIFKVATIYAVSAWPLIQIADLAVPALGLPDSVMALLFKIVIIGFPIILVIAWLINFTSEGITRANARHKEHNPAKANFRTTVAVAGSLAVAMMGTIIGQMAVEPVATTDQPAVNQAQAALGVSSAGSLPKDQGTSIAVLPFVPFSDDVEDEYFVDGMVEELLNLLTKVPDLQVAARTSSFSYKGVTDKTIVEIGKELGVETILEGSFRKNEATNRIRVTAKLIDVASGGQLWSETYDREYLDIFKIQDEITSAVANNMKLALLGNEAQAGGADSTTSVDAMVEYGKGQNELSHRTVPSLELALQHFKSATGLDEKYARAHVGVADANILLALYGSLPTETARKRAQSAIQKALAINANLGAAYATRGLLLSPQDAEAAEQAFIKAIELSPNYAMTFMWYGSLKRDQGDLAKAKQLFEKALDLDPKSAVATFNVAWSHYLDGFEDKAMELFSQILANDPFYPGAYILAGDILRNRGRLDEAIDMYERALKVDALNKSAVSGLIVANLDIGDIEAADRWFDYAENRPDLLSQFEIASMKARYFAVQNQLDKAIDYLSKVELDPENTKGSLSMLAEQQFYIGNYAAAADYYQQLKSTDTGNQGFFYLMKNGENAAHLAFSYQQQDIPVKAIEIIFEQEKFLKKSTNKQANSPTFYYAMALIRALQDNETEAFSYLQGAIDVGWVQSWKADIEPIFSKLRSRKRYSLMMGGVNARLANMRTRLQGKADFVAGE